MYAYLHHQFTVYPSCPQPDPEAHDVTDLVNGSGEWEEEEILLDRVSFLTLSLLYRVGERIYVRRILFLE